VTVAYLDESGFSPSQPTTRSWTLPGERKRIPYENPRGRRVNVLAALLPFGPQPELWWDAVARTFTATDVLTILESIPRRGRGLVVVLDNAAIHRSHVIRDALPRLQAQGITLRYLPAYSPELNRIEPIFGVVKQHELPNRSYTTVPALRAAIDIAFAAVERRLLRSQHELRPTA
jgi:putative transposase